MTIITRLASVLLASTALAGAALAQDTGVPDSGTPPTADPGPVSPALAGPDDAEDQSTPPEEELEVSIPGGGGEIVVTGQRNRDPGRSSTQVVSVLSAADIARTGEGNIAGSLARVTGLSVVGSGFVYVRGLGDRYSLALLNGLPLPSPEPLRRVVPLDLFPTGVIASSLVQKSYSANFPGEFGGGVINLTTRATPAEPFLSVGFGISGDSFTTFNNGLTHFGGGDSDWLGFDDGGRQPSGALADYFAAGQLIGTDPVDSTALAATIVTGNNAVVQRMKRTPANVSLSASGGKSWPLGSGEIGVIFGGGYSSRWLTRQATQQTSSSGDLAAIESDFERVTTDQRAVFNGLFGLAWEFGDANTVRWTNLYIHDALKQTRLAIGSRPAQNAANDYLQQSTGFFERQLIDTQLVGEFRLRDTLRLDVRGSYANSQRQAPGQLDFEYVRTNADADPFGGQFVNRLNGNSGTASVTYQDLEEDLWAGSGDLRWDVLDSASLTIGGAYTDQQRFSSRRQLLFRAPSEFLGFPEIISGVGLLRPDFLLSPDVVETIGITLVENDPGAPAFDAGLRVWAGYAKADWRIGDAITLDVGARYEDAEQTVRPRPVFTAIAPVAGTTLANDYWLPAATLTWQLRSDLQARVSASRTIARPQFRELIPQPYYDPDSNRSYVGNPLLDDSKLTSGEARLEWYFARDQRISLAGFYKRIDRPIESFVFGSDLTTSYANAPQADLYGGEFEAQKYFDLSGWGGMFATRRAVVIANYTYTHSAISVQEGDTTAVFGAASTLATDYFRDGAPLTGQSDHLINLQLGLEDTERQSQQTILVTYASDRVVSRGLFAAGQPDVIERPGLQLDFVAREGITVFATDLDLKLEVRNILGTRYQEFQQAGDARIDTNSYKRGTVFSLGVTANF